MSNRRSATRRGIRIIGVSVAVAATVAIASAAPSQAATSSIPTASQGPASWVSGDHNPCSDLMIALIGLTIAGV
jgi:hypothetical protein